MSSQPSGASLVPANFLQTPVCPTLKLGVSSLFFESYSKLGQISANCYKMSLLVWQPGASSNKPLILRWPLSLSSNGPCPPLSHIRPLEGNVGSLSWYWPISVEAHSVLLLSTPATVLDFRFSNCSALHNNHNFPNETLQNVSREFDTAKHL